jgi:hypothetical protein
MSEPSPYALSKLFSDLVGRKVTFAQTNPAPEAKIAQMYGVYTVLPHETTVIAKCDLPLLGSLAGLLVGLPDSAVKDHLKANPLEELMRDAIHEVLNIASAVITTEGRAIFLKMVTDGSYIDGPAGQVFKKPDRRCYFNVTVDGYQGGRFTILWQLVPVAQ